MTFSVSRSSPPLPPVETEVTRRSSRLMVRYSRGFSPALRTTRVALSKCLPLQQASIRSGLVLSMYLVKLRSCTLHLPAPAPPPTWAEPELDRPQDQASTSISALWVV